MAPRTILIISPDRDFSQTVAEQIKRELSLVCQIADTNEQAKPLAAAASLVVISGEGGKFPCPVVAVKSRPVRMRDVLAEIEAALPKSTDDALMIGDYVLQLRKKQLMHTSGKAASLTDKETQLLQCLAVAGNKGVAKEQLLKDVWGFEAELNTHTLETHIYRLRGKLRELAGEEMIEAMESGYRLSS